MLALQNLTRRFGGRVVLNSISHRFPEQGCVGLVGVNPVPVVLVGLA